MRYGMKFVGIVAIGMFLLATSGKYGEAADFHGDWSAGEDTELSFGLDLRQDGASIIGYHCGTTKDASRIDCSIVGDETTIEGSATENRAEVRFTSAYSGAVGTARLTLQAGDTLLWEITEFPDGEFYLPAKAILTRSKPSPSRTQDIPTGSPLERLSELVSKDLKAKSYQYPVRLNSDYVVRDDFNFDGIDDVAAIFLPVDDGAGDSTGDVRNENQFLAIGFGAPGGGLTLALNAQDVPCSSCGGVYGEPELSLDSRKGVLAFGSYGGSTWRWEILRKIRYEEGVFRVIGYTETSSHIDADVVFTCDINLNTMDGIRTYSYQKNRDTQGEVRFKHLAASRVKAPLKIDGVLNEADWKEAQQAHIREASSVVHKPENWSGAADLSFTASALWDDQALYIGIAVSDDKVVPVENAENMLKGDHLELWFDFAESLVMWDLGGWPLRQKPDGSIRQIGIGVPAAGENVPVRMLYPDKAPQELGITGAMSRTNVGYALEVRLPMGIFEETWPSDFEWTVGCNFGFGIVLSDTDNPADRRQDCLMATSPVKWGNPWTFGGGSLVENYQKPEYPLTNWRVRY